MNTYSIHGFLKVSSNEPLQRLSRFAASIDSADITVSFGGFRPNFLDLERVEKVWVGSDAVYCEDTYKTLHYRLMISGITTGQLKISFDSRHPMNREVFYVLILEPLFTYELARRGILLLHASAASINGKGVVISGGTGVGKTTTLLRLLKNPGVKYLSDDQTIVHGGEVYPYPMPIGMRLHHVWESGAALKPRDFAKVCGHALANVATGYYGNLTHRVQPEDLGVQVSPRVPLRYVFMLNLDSPSLVKKSPRMASLELLLNHNRRNEDKQRLIARFLAKYSIVNPPFNYWERYRTLLYDLTGGDAEFYEVRIDRKYGVEESVKRILEIVEH